MKQFFLKYLWRGTLEQLTLIALVEVFLQIPLYIISYPKGHIFHSIIWTIWLSLCIFLQIRKHKKEKYVKNW